MVSEGHEAYQAQTFDGERSRGFGEHIVLNIATVAERLPEWFKEQHPDVGWPALKGMRNLIAHVHDGVDDELVWRALEKRVPWMIAQLIDDPPPRWRSTRCRQPGPAPVDLPSSPSSALMMVDGGSLGERVRRHGRV